MESDWEIEYRLTSGFYLYTNMSIHKYHRERGGGRRGRESEGEGGREREEGGFQSKHTYI
jgi:hypothetical protein